MAETEETKTVMHKLRVKSNGGDFQNGSNRAYATTQQQRKKSKQEGW